ncbi:MAG: serine--tRNA ligase [Planctomycetota bacterium]|jgi:seryl-tRNA synthetase
MIDIKLIREDPQRFAKAAADKRIEFDVDALLAVDGELGDLRREFQDLRTAQRSAGKDIAKLKGDEKAVAVAKMTDIKTRLKDVEGRIADLEPRLNELMLLAAQPPADDVPVGADDTENVELRREGEIRQFDFEPADHIALGEALGIIDVPRGVKLAGSRNYILCGAGAALHQAVLRLAVDQMTAKGYTLLNVPVLVNEQIMVGTGYFPIGRDDAYLCERDEMSLVGTAEVPLTAVHGDEILEHSDLPKKYMAMSTCFRREAGAAGKDTHGLYRIHFFDKVEQVVVCQNDEPTSLEFHQEILRNAEDVLQALRLPYRVLNVCTGDLGLGQVQKFDIETWMPSRNSYGETHSASRFHEFQARRLNIRYRDADGRVQFVHTLNNTVIASPRVLIPILELYQNADGTVTVPEALRPYMNGLDVITPV